jgi:hypothetical protein
MAQIVSLQAGEGKELLGVETMTHFRRLRLQPLQARPSQMWDFTVLMDKSSTTEKDWPIGELKKIVRHLTKLKKDDTIPSSSCVTPFDATNAPLR